MAVWAYHEPRGNPCDCGLPRSRHRVRHERGCQCGCSHKGSRSPSDKRRTRAERAFTVGLDGEGVGRAPHRYTLLAWSDAEGRRTKYIQNAAGLSTLACLRFLISMPRNARVFGYYLGYDWTKILTDLPNRDIYLLMRPQLRARPKDEGGGFSPVLYRGYQIQWLAGMVVIKRGSRTVTIWDVGKFYQGPFVEALKDAKIGTSAEIADIESMKGRRSEFSDDETDIIRGYCLKECKLLAQLVDQLNAAHEQAGLPLRTWYGPGSAATVALKRMGIAGKRGVIPEDMRIPVACGFFGGRFEHATIGRVAGPIYSYDIVSAYPAQLVQLPCLEHARWRYSNDKRDIRRAEQALVAWELVGRSKRAWGPLPVRLPNGSIVYPSTGASGWCWLAEFRAARAWSQVRFVGAWILERECDCVPFALISELFETRRRVGRKSAVGGALKRTYNSCYGKLAQVVGDPPFRCQPWAGMITSGTRAQLLAPMAAADDAILAVATDGIYSRARLDLDIGERLGQWEAGEPTEDIVLVRPGIYWNGKVVRSRGLPRKSVSKHQSAILRALESGASEAKLPPVNQFGGAGACVYRTPGALKRAPRYGEWYERPARISFDPRPKRRADWGLWELPDVESRPYRPGLLPPDAVMLRIAELLAEGMG